MARDYKLTWIESEQRWRKMYRGHRLSFSGEGGKKASYLAAKREFERRKAEIDAQRQPEQQREKVIATLQDLMVQIPAVYHDGHAARSLYQAIERLELEITEQIDGGKLSKEQIAGLADRRIAGLTRTYAPIAKGTTARFRDLPSQEEIDRQERERLASRIDSPENQERVRAGLDTISPPPLSDARIVEIFPHPSDAASGPAPWEASVTARIDTLQDLLDAFIVDKTGSAKAGQISLGRVGTVKIHAEAFIEWAGRRKKVASLTSSLFMEYRHHVMKCIADGKLSTYTARDRLTEAKSLARFALSREAIDKLPQCIDPAMGQKYSISLETKDPEPITRDEIKTLLHHATDRQRLYLLIGLNCGFQGADISDLRRDEIDVSRGMITRKRSKTKQHKNAPVVTYKLWPETIAVCKRFLESSGDLAFLAENGSQLITKRLDAKGKYAKADSIDSSWDRLRKKSSVDASFTRLRKTGATWLNQQERFARFVQLYLAHVPSSVADRHYAGADLAGFHEALDAMRDALIT